MSKINWRMKIEFKYLKKSNEEDKTFIFIILLMMTMMLYGMIIGGEKVWLAFSLSFGALFIIVGLIEPLSKMRIIIGK